MKTLILILCLVFVPGLALAGPYAPAAGVPTSTAVAHDSTSIVGWASGYQDLVRGPLDISDPGEGLVSHGSADDALGLADASYLAPYPVVSLGDGGQIVLTFTRPIGNGFGADFVVFENGITDDFLELAFVEVSSDGANFFRFAAVSLTQTATQVDQTLPSPILDPTNLYNLAGKYRVGFGTPFDLAELAGTPGLDINSVTHVRIEDVVGSIDPLYRTLDSGGRAINDPWPTPFATGGFDLDAVGVLHFSVPEPSATVLLGLAALSAAARRRR